MLSNSTVPLFLQEDLFIYKDTQRQNTLMRIEQNLKANGESLEQAIFRRNLYFRVSLLGSCNLSCPFCHNEGAPTKGKLDIAFAVAAMEAASNIGFHRVQFTGGEPLLHPEVDKFVFVAQNFFDEVGLTTNGTFLPQKIDKLIKAGIQRIHLSLQVETLRHNTEWEIPEWLEPILSLSSKGYFVLRLNLPVPANELLNAKNFLRKMSIFGCDLKVFSILPEGSTGNLSYPIQELEQIVTEENFRRMRENLGGEILLRGYTPPNGIRCKSCKEFSKCKEQSRSLRLGSDHVLRPCLATRVWDDMAEKHSLLQQIRDAALLALDYTW